MYFYLQCSIILRILNNTIRQTVKKAGKKWLDEDFFSVKNKIGENKIEHESKQRRKRKENEKKKRGEHEREKEREGEMEKRMIVPESKRWKLVIVRVQGEKALNGYLLERLISWSEVVILLVRKKQIEKKF